MRALRRVNPVLPTLKCTTATSWIFAEVSMPKENPLSALLSQLNKEYTLSEEFKTRVSNLIEKLEGLNLPNEQIQTLLGKVRETYERQVLVESCREESRKSLTRIQDAI